MSKKTVMQELLEWCEYRRSKSVNSHLGAWNMIITKIKDEQLPIEKQQIKSAFELGMIKASSSSRYISDIEAENYYSQTYQNETE